jgi:hypothetical protein
MSVIIIARETENHYYIQCAKCTKVIQYSKRVKPSDSTEWITREPKSVMCVGCGFGIKAGA